MKRVLCYGDSNTWGSATTPRPDERYDAEERWPGVMRARLGAGWTVIEEGLPGRTTVHPDPIEGAWLSGSSYLVPCLRSHRPLDTVVVTLGTNDLKARFGVPAGDIAAGVGVLLDIVGRAEAGRGGGIPKMLVVCPAPILDHHGERPDFNDMFEGGRAKSLKLAPLYEVAARSHGARFLNAGDHIRSSAFDGIHLDAEAHLTLGEAIAKAVSAMSDA